MTGGGLGMITYATEHKEPGGRSYVDGITVTEEYKLSGRQIPLWQNLFCAEASIKLYMEK